MAVERPALGETAAVGWPTRGVMSHKTEGMSRSGARRRTEDRILAT